jgi:NhaP-type Na+/H+ and K+/H+ antiporter
MNLTRNKHKIKAVLARKASIHPTQTYLLEENENTDEGLASDTLQSKNALFQRASAKQSQSKYHVRPGMLEVDAVNQTLELRHSEAARRRTHAATDARGLTSCFLEWSVAWDHLQYATIVHTSTD